MISNYFDIEVPDEWHCNVYDIDADSNLKLKLFKPYTKEERKWIRFVFVAYYDVLTLWEGANFQVASDDDCVGLLRSLSDKHIQKMTDSELIDTYSLFQVALKKPDGSPGRYMQIVAKDAVMD